MFLGSCPEKRGFSSHLPPAPAHRFRESSQMAAHDSFARTGPKNPPRTVDRQARFAVIPLSAGPRPVNTELRPYPRWRFPTMRLNSLLPHWQSRRVHDRGGRGPRARACRRRASYRAHLEGFEDRCLLSYLLTDLGTLGGPNPASETAA